MDNKYQDKLDEHLHNMTNVMFTFEITKACGYSTFVTVYKEETLIDLYVKVIEHFSLHDLKELFFYAPTGERIRIPLSKQTISEFIKKHTIGLNNSVNLVPIYTLPRPVIYRLYLDECGCC
jgi:hypothetical protein